MRDFEKIEKLENTGLVKTIYTKKGWDEWPSNELDKAFLYEELTDLFGTGSDNVVRIPQTHTNKARIIQSKNRGEGVKHIADEGYDAMITNTPGIILCTVEADCVPVYMLDPVNKVIGMIHSGWKGTAGNISANTALLMNETYKSKAKDTIACLGPCICGNCYEVGAELITEFKQQYTQNEIDQIFIPKNNGKFLLNLPGAIRMSLVKIGFLEENIIMPPMCTYESKELCSWRRDKNSKSRMLTGIMLKE